jgi:hypothetical protein
MNVLKMLAANAPATGNQTLYQIIDGLGLTTNLKLCLDSGDSASYDPSVQTSKWLDTSGNGYDFFRGATGSSEASDPTFNGTAGGLSSSEYWSFDGGDRFTYDAINETWMNNLHKNNAKFSYVIACNLQASAVPQAFFGTNGDAAASRIGFRSQCTALEALQIIASNGSSQNFITPGINIPTSQSIILGQSQDESSATGLYSFVNTDTTTTNGEYTTPSTSNATYTMQIGASGSAVRPLVSGARLYCIAIWEDVTLSSTDLTNIYNILKGRFGL